ncbi:PIN domain-like protein [Suillus weaverae]|nr:PIN domain-like protein [Suillus weaverae]
MGVKSLWDLLSPVGRPVPLETIEGKALAIDSSIWIYQFQATMRDKEGRALVNAHVLGFFRRICKLLFYGIRPVFVFDGGAPALKRNTIIERKKKKSGAVATHAKIAERLLAAHMRREALVHAQASHPSSSKGKQKAPSGPVVLDENAVYLEDIDNSAPKTPAKKKAEETPSSKKKARFYDHDPYRLPEVDLEERVAKATSSQAPDPRLATEEELRTFIEEMRPEDFDVSSAAFRELPTEVQYEIVGDLRLKSRQTSYKRLQNMLQKAETPLDFSREQIKNLKQRNALTQQLLTTTDSIGKAHITIPVRIASERNREYVLVKNEGADGGWVLGIRDDGTRSKPIEIDQDKPTLQSDSDDDMEMEEVSIPGNATPDPDLREFQASMALHAIGKRSQPSVPKPVQRRIKSKPLFDLDDDEDISRPLDDEFDHIRDPELALAIQASLEDHTATYKPITPEPSPSQLSLPTTPQSKPALRLHDSDDDLYTSPSRLETVLSIAGAGPVPRLSGTLHDLPSQSVFGKAALLVSPKTSSRPMPIIQSCLSESEESMDEVLSVQAIEVPHRKPSPVATSAHVEPPQSFKVLQQAAQDSDNDMEEVPVIDGGHVHDIPESSVPTAILAPEDAAKERQSVFPASFQLPKSLERLPQPSTSSVVTPEARIPESDDVSDIEWSRSPSPVLGTVPESVDQGASAAVETWDAAEEMDPHAEEGEFARFISQVKGKDLDAVRHEIDEEIRTLKQQKKAAMRDSEDITQQMISQIMLLLRLFGIPYITAPMEAEAQCAELVSLGLVEGIITDDSDVFLFGGMRVFKNMFNQSKTVECFLSSDLSRELGLERDTLIRLAYLLGSDYVEGLPGIGPVIAMELLKEFPGEDGLHKFKDWWTKVQSGRDRADDNTTKFRNRFKKKFKNLFLPPEWPNALVRDAYYHPTVDSSDEPFKWGMPDLDALRHFFHEELRWNQAKVDETLLPIIQNMNKRNQATAMNRQGNLNSFFDVAPGSGSYAPRKRQAYGSKRLQQVVTDFQNQQANRNTSTPVSDEADDLAPEDGKEPATKKRKTGAKSRMKTSPVVAQQKRQGTGTGHRGKGRGTGARGSPSKTVQEPESENGDEYVGNVIDDGPSAKETSKPRLRPRARPVAKGSRISDRYTILAAESEGS